MRNYILMLILLLALASTTAGTARGEAAAKVKATSNATAQTPANSPQGVMEKLSVTPHSIKLNGQTLDYTATAGYLLIKNDAGKLQARMFFVAYTKNGVPDRARRPLSFAFNGGPGASSVWLHLGGVGPKRVVLADHGTALPDSDRLVDNPYTWLRFTDLVFVDPIGTGYSRAAEGVDARQFYDVRKDIDVSADFIRLYVSQYERWLSPKFVIGESYGTTRAAGLASHLQSSSGLDLAGVILLSSALDFQSFESGNGNDLPYALALPTFTAVAAYHHKLPTDSATDLPATLSRVDHWALNGYLTALAAGDTLSQVERERVIADLAHYTGLSTNYLEASRCRVSAVRFTRQLLRSENRTVGLLDGRVVGVDVSKLGEYPQYDPAMFLVTGPYVAAFNQYVRHNLQFKTSLPYEFLSTEVNHSWKWDSAGQGYLYVGDNLAEALSRDARFRVFVGAGRYDLTTPYLGQKYTFNHLGLDPSLRRHITFKVYPSGHQIYTDMPSLKQLDADVAAFVAAAPGETTTSASKSGSASSP